MLISLLLTYVIFLIRPIKPDDCNIQYGYKLNLDVLDVWFNIAEPSQYIEISWKLVESRERTTIQTSRRSLIKCDIDGICPFSIFDVNRLSPYLLFVDTEICTQREPLKIFRNVENIKIDYIINGDSRVVFQSEMFKHKKYICHIQIKEIHDGRRSSTDLWEEMYNYCDEPSYEMPSEAKFVRLVVQIKGMSIATELVIEKNNLKESPFIIDRINDNKIEIAFNYATIENHDIYLMENYFINEEPLSMYQKETLCEKIKSDADASGKFSCTSHMDFSGYLRLENKQEKTQVLREAYQKNNVATDIELIDDFHQFKIVFTDMLLDKNNVEYIIDELHGNQFQKRLYCTKKNENGCIGFFEEKYIIFEKQYIKSYRIKVFYRSKIFEKFIQWRPSMIKFYHVFETNHNNNKMMTIWSNIPEDYNLSCSYTLTRVETFFDGYNAAGTYDSYGSLSHNGYKSCSNYSIDISLIDPKSLHIYIAKLNYLYSIEHLYEKLNLSIMRNENSLKIKTTFNNEFCNVKFVDSINKLRYEFSNLDIINNHYQLFKCDSTFPYTWDDQKTTEPVGMYLKLVETQSVFYIDLFYNDEDLIITVDKSIEGELNLQFNKRLEIKQLKYIKISQIDGILNNSVLFYKDYTKIHTQGLDDEYWIYTLDMGIVLAKTVYLEIKQKNDVSIYRILQIPDLPIDFQVHFNGRNLEMSSTHRIYNKGECKFVVKSHTKSNETIINKLTYFQNCNEKFVMENMYEENDVSVYNKNKLVHKESFTLYNNKLITGLEYYEDKIIIRHKHEGPEYSNCKIEIKENNRNGNCVLNTESCETTRICTSVSFDMEYNKDLFLKFTSNNANNENQEMEEFTLKSIPLKIIWDHTWTLDSLLIYTKRSYNNIKCCHKLEGVIDEESSDLLSGSDDLTSCVPMDCNHVIYRPTSFDDLGKYQMLTFSVKIIGNKQHIVKYTIGRTKHDYILKTYEQSVYYSHIFKEINPNSLKQKWYLHKDGVITELKSNINEIDVDGIKYMSLKPDMACEYKLFIGSDIDKSPILIDYYPENNFENMGVTVTVTETFDYGAFIIILYDHSKKEKKFIKLFVYSNGAFREDPTPSNLSTCNNEFISTEINHCSFVFDLQPNAIIKLCLEVNGIVDSCKIYKSKYQMRNIKLLSIVENKYKVEVSFESHVQTKCFYTYDLIDQKATLSNPIDCYCDQNNFNITCSKLNAYFFIQNHELVYFVMDNNAEFNGLIKMPMPMPLKTYWNKLEYPIIHFENRKKIEISFDTEEQCEYSIDGDQHGVISQHDMTLAGTTTSETTTGGFFVEEPSCPNISVKYLPDEHIQLSYAYNTRNYMPTKITRFKKTHLEYYNAILLGQSIHFHGKTNRFLNYKHIVNCFIYTIQNRKNSSGELNKTYEIIENVEIVCEGYSCLNIPQKIKLANIHKYHLSLKIFDQNIQVNRIPLLISVDFVLISEKVYKIIYKIDQLQRTITLNEHIYDESKNVCYVSNKKKILCNQKTCEHKVTLLNNCRIPTILKIYSDYIRLSKTVFEIEEKSLVLFEYEDPGDNDQYKIYLKLKLNENNKSHVSEMIHIEFTKIQDDCYNLINLDENDFSVVELFSNCSNPRTRIQYPNQLEVIPEYRQIHLYKASGKVFINEKTIKIYIFTPIPLKSLDMSYIKVSDIGDTDHLFEDADQNTIDCIEKICKYDIVLSDNALIKSDLKIIFRSMQLTDMVLIYHKESYSTMNYHLAKYKEDNVIVYLDGYTILPGMVVSLGINNIMGDSSVITELPNGKYYCEFNKDSISDGTYFTFPNTQTNISIEKFEEKIRYEMEYIWKPSKLNILLKIYSLETLQNLNINYFLYKENQEQHNPTPVNQNVNCYINICDWEIENINSSEDHILSLDSPKFPNPISHYIMKDGCPLRKIRKAIKSTNTISIIMQLSTIYKELNIRYSVSDIKTTHINIMSGTDKKIKCFKNECTFSIAGITITKNYKVVMTLPQCSDDISLIIGKAPSDYILTYNYRTDRSDKVTLIIQLQLTMPYESITFEWILLSSSNSKISKNSVITDILPQEQGLFIFEIQQVDIGFKYDLEFMSEYLSGKTNKNIAVKMPIDYEMTQTWIENQLLITLHLDVPINKFSAIIKCSTLTKTGREQFNNKVETPFDVTSECTLGVCEYSISFEKHDEYYKIEIVSDLLKKNQPIIINRDPSSYDIKYKYENKLLLVGFTLNRDFEKLFLKWNLYDEANNLVNSSNDLFEQTLKNNNEFTLNVGNPDQTKLYTLIFESEELSGVKPLKIEKRFNYELKYKWEYHRLIITLEMSQADSSSDLSINYYIYEKNNKPENPISLNRNIDCQINICSFGIESLELKYSVDHVLFLQSEKLVDSNEHDIEREPCPFSNISNEYLLNEKLAVNIELKYDYKELNVTYSISEFGVQDNIIITESNKKIPCNEMLCDFIISNLKTTKNYNLGLEIPLCNEKQTTVIKNVKSDYSLTYSYRKEDSNKVTLLIELGLMMSYDKISLDWVLKANGNVKNSLATQEITKENEIFTFEIQEVDSGSEYTIEFTSDYLIDKPNRNIIVKLPMNYEINYIWIDEKVSLTIKPEVPITQFMAKIEYSTIKKTESKKFVEKEKKTTDIMLNCVQGVCNYLLTDVNKDEYYHIGIVSELLQIKTPIFLNREPSSFIVQYKYEEELLLVEFILNKDFGEISLKWHLMDTENNSIKSSNQLLDEILCKSKKCTMSIEKLDQSKQYKLVFESEELSGVDELLIEVNWEILLNVQEEFDKKMEEKKDKPLITAKFIQAWDKVVYKEIETETTNTTSEANAKIEKDEHSLYLTRINILDKSILDFEVSEEVRSENIVLKSFALNETRSSIYFTKPMGETEINDVLDNSTIVANPADPLQSTYITVDFSADDSSEEITATENKIVLAVAKNKVSQNSTQTTDIIAGDVLVIKISNHHIKGLNITFSQVIDVDDSKSQFRCCTLDRETLKWETKYCSVLKKVSLSNSFTNYTCSCNHTTSYAIIYDIYDNDYSKNIYYQHEVSIFLSCISMIFIFITVVCILSSKIRTKLRVLVQLWMCLAIFIFHLAFLLGNIYNEAYDSCFHVAVFLHYGVMSQYFALLTNSLVLFQNLVLTMRNIKDTIIKLIAFIIMIIPIIVATICGIHFSQHYVYKNNCIPYGPLKLATITIPGVLILLFNLLVFLMVFHTIYKSEITHKKKSSLKKRAKQLVFLFTLLGMPMIVQLVASCFESEFLQLISNVLNTSMGTFLFFILVVGNEEMSNHVKSTLGTYVTDKNFNRSSQRQSRTKSATRLTTFSIKSDNKQ